jgi:hypothetical protein
MSKILGVLGLALLLSGAAAARDMQLTIYDDGRSCPGNCDAHVVINDDDNGTRFAFSPASTRQNPRPCAVGQLCRICFGEPDATCMTARYRGAGPPLGKFDFTPAFYDEHCARSDIPAALRRQCTSLNNAIQRGGYDRRINCFAEPAHSACRNLLASATAAQQADIPKRDRCLALGEARYNREQSNPRERRSNACNYSEQRLGGPNRNGVRWRLLLPAACRDGTFVGRDGLDCCSANLRFVASVDPECAAFFPRRS